MILALAADEVASTPVGLVALLGVFGLIGGALAGMVALHRYVFRPLRNAADKLQEFHDLPDSFRDVASTLTKYVAENEKHRQQADARLNRVENAIALWAFRVLGPTPGHPLDDPPPPHEGPTE